MKKIITSLFFIIAGVASLNAQIGINTENPQAIFHVDGAKNNPNTGIPTTAQQTDDFVVTSQGNVGLGITAPSVKLDIRSSSPGAIKIVDGTQGEGKILTSDADGVAKWTDNIDLPDLPKIYATGRKTSVTTCTGTGISNFALTDRKNMNADGSFIANKDGYYQITASISQYAEAFSYGPAITSSFGGNIGFYNFSYTYRGSGWNWYKNSATVVTYVPAGNTIAGWGWSLGGTNTCNSTNRVGNQEVIVLYMGN